MIWQSDKGAKVQWTAMGDGCVDLQTLFKEWSDACPETPVQIETISGFAKEFPYLEKDFWPPIQLFDPMIIHVFSLLPEKVKHWHHSCSGWRG